MGIKVKDGKIVTDGPGHGGKIVRGEDGKIVRKGGKIVRRPVKAEPKNEPQDD